MKKSCLTISLVVTALAATSPSADVYRYFGNDGTACFTDSPTRKDAVLIMKDPAHPPTAGGKPHRGKKISKKKVMYASAAACDEPENLPVAGRLTSRVGLRHDPIDGVVRYHNGVDIAIPEGTPVRTVAPGTVVYSGRRSGYGNLVIVEHDDGMSTSYAHNRFNNVIAGERVDRDRILAYSGSTGRSTGPHLHFEAWRGGTNVTSAFLKSWGAVKSETAPMPRTVKIRTALLPDGSILFTNLPYSY
jgi:murein DD-endopeptidase MepM/ murein hydrolase activator NlpD